MTVSPPQAASAPIHPRPRIADEGDWPPGPFRSAAWRTKVATLAHALAGLATLATAAVVVLAFPLLDRVERFQATAAEVDEWFGRLETVNSLEALFTFIAFVTLLIWLSRSVDNTPALGGGVARRGPRWAIGAWFIPVVNFVMPALILRDLARRLSPDGRGRDKLVLAWWLSYWAPLIIGVYLGTLPIAGTDSVREFYASQLLWQIVAALGYFVTLFMIRRLQRDAEYWQRRAPLDLVHVGSEQEFVGWGSSGQITRTGS